MTIRSLFFIVGIGGIILVAVSAINILINKSEDVAQKLKDNDIA